MAGAGALRARWPSLTHRDFAAVVALPPCQRSPHFCLHHLAGSPLHAPLRAPIPRAPADSIEISTGAAPTRGSSVDISHWLGLVVPKRHARRAVTRSLVKRQMRQQVEVWGGRMPRGQWVLRLRAPFARTAFPSAASAALRTAVRTELDALFVQAFGR